MCDGQALPSPGRWPVASRRYPTSPIWKAVTRKFEHFSAQYGMAELLVNLALGRVQENTFSEKDIQDLKHDVINELERAGLELKREADDRRDVPIDFRYLDLLLSAAEDPEVGLGQFSQGVRDKPSVSMPRLPALYRPKRKWFELLHSTHHLGISQRRAAWFTKWAREVADQVHMARFEEGLGRTMFVVGALELERPFLAPLYRFMSLHPRSSVRRVPPYVRILPPLSGRPSLGLQALQLRGLDGKHNGGTACSRAGKQREDGDRRLVPAKRTGRQDRCQRVAMVFARTERGRLALGPQSGSKTSACHLDSKHSPC